MIEWERDDPVTMGSFSTREILEAWCRLIDDDYPIKDQRGHLNRNEEFFFRRTGG
jgi:hypothetical protein